MFAAQTGKSTVLENILGYHIDQDPAPILMVQPTLEMGESFSKDRIAPMLRDTPCLRGSVKDARTRDSGNTLLHKTFPGGHITIAGANSPASLASRPIRIVLADEIDRYPSSAGTEGDPVGLARKRTSTFWNRKVILMSTPTIAGRSRIEKAFKTSDKRRYFVPCPECGEVQDLKWPQVEWAGEDAETARYKCKCCEAKWDDAQRWRAVRAGAWQATAPFTGVAGFHLNVLYSPWVKLREVVADFMRVKNDPEQLKVWVNTALAETWKERGEAPDSKRLFDRREDYPTGVVPLRARFLTASVDVQADRLECEVKAWGPGKENWSIWYEVIQPSREDSTGKKIFCRTSEPEPWAALADLIGRDWEVESGGSLPIWCCAIDTGYSPQIAYDFCRRYPQPAHGPAGSRIHSVRTVVPIKGGHNAHKLIENVSDSDAARKRAGLKIVTVGTPNAKQQIYDALRLESPADGVSYPAGYCHHPDYDFSYFQGLTAETRLVKQSGAIEWRKDGRNEPLDLHVYNLAAAELCGISRMRAEHWTEFERRRESNAQPVDMPVNAARGAVRDEEEQYDSIGKVKAPITPARRVRYQFGV